MSYPTVHQLIGRIAARTGIDFTAHMLRHTHATELIRRGVPIEVVARLLTHRSSTTTSQIYVHLDAADVREALTRAGVWDESEDADERPVRRGAIRPARPALVAARRPASTASTPPTTGTPAAGRPRPPRAATARFDAISQPWLRDPVKRWSRFRLATGCAFTTISAGALAMSRFSAFLAECHPGVTDEARITRPVLEDYLSWLVTQGYSAATRALSLSHDPGVLRGLPPPRLAARACCQTPSSTSRNSPSTTTRSPGSSPSS